MKALSPDTVVGVIGAGTMGAGIAQVAAQTGHPVLLYDAEPKAVEQGVARVGKGLDRLVERGKMKGVDRDALLGRIQGAERLEQLRPAGLVVEAIAESLEVKREVFGRLEDICTDQTIQATNTSSLSITAIGASLKRPDRLVGMHFFNPAPIMKLVEVVSGAATSRLVAETVHATAAAWGKHPVHARSSPGFIVNRVARPFYAESLRVLEEGGADIATIDAIVRECGGFRMGPFELIDLIGTDVNLAVTRSIFEAYHYDPRFKPSLVQQELVAAGHLGRKSGQGFYHYDENAEQVRPATADPVSCPDKVKVLGSLGAAEPLLDLLQAAGIKPAKGEGPGVIQAGTAQLALADGRYATARSAEDQLENLVQFDLALDYAKATRFAVAPADQTSPQALSDATGLLQALGKPVSVIDDYPGMVVMRTVCMLANEAADAVNQNICNALDVDTAMRSGLNYPRGPLDWADAIGMSTVLTVLDNLARTYGEDRYRASALLRRRIAAGQPLSGA